MFPSSHDPKRQQKSKTVYRQKKCLMKEAGTLDVSVNRDDRKFGAMLARLMGVPIQDIEHLGLWSLKVIKAHYVKIHSPSTVAQMAGFPDAASYFLPRNFISPFDVDDEGIQAFAHAVFPQLDDPCWIDAIAEVGPTFLHHEVLHNVNGFHKCLDEAN